MTLEQATAVIEQLKIEAVTNEARIEGLISLLLEKRVIEGGPLGIHVNAQVGRLNELGRQCK